MGEIKIDLEGGPHKFKLKVPKRHKPKPRPGGGGLETVSYKSGSKYPVKVIFRGDTPFMRKSIPVGAHATEPTQYKRHLKNGFYIYRVVGDLDGTEKTKQEIEPTEGDIEIKMPDKDDKKED
jgi:hypothetical protein